jgi:hypothetical protein
MTEDAVARRRRRAADTARCRDRRRRCVSIFQIEAGVYEFELARLYAGLEENQMTDKAAISRALGRLLRRGLIALMNEKPNRRTP